MPRRHSVARCRHVKAADLPTKAGAPNRDRLVSHHVRPRAQTVSEYWLRLLLESPQRRPRQKSSGRPPQTHARQGARQSAQSPLGVVCRGPCSRNSHNVAAPHRSSNSATASIHFSASSSRDRSSAATCRATRRRTVLDRASGTTKRSSFKPRARRRSRMAFIRSAACTI